MDHHVQHKQLSHQMWQYLAGSYPVPGLELAPKRISLLASQTVHFATSRKQYVEASKFFSHRTNLSSVCRFEASFLPHFKELHMMSISAMAGFPSLALDTMTRLTCHLGHRHALCKCHSFHCEFPCAKHTAVSWIFFRFTSFWVQQRGNSCYFSVG